MSSAQVGIVLGYIRKLATARKDLELPDHQLLERFAAHRDEAAFAALLKRHGPMVLGVCHSVLHNLHDAEDVFQAAFLVLARKAGSIHRREAVSSWLHRVAYHLAVKAQANAARRRVLEKRAVTMPSADPVLDMSLRELRGVLNEELQKLPEEYRAPLVLCCLEEKSLEEAARLLGWTRSTVKGRLQRGRERLRARLRRRGLELSAGLFATALSTSSASAQVSATLATSTLKAALWLAAGKEPVAGVISAQVAALIQGASKTMFYSKLKVATAVLLAVVLSTAGLGVLGHQAIAAKQENTGQKEVTKQAATRGEKQALPTEKDAKDSVTVRGRVLDPDGKPVAGAKLYVNSSSPKQKVFPVRATSGDDGRFEFTLAKSELTNTDAAAPSVLDAQAPPAQMLAAAEGYGADWANVDNGDVTLRLPKRAGLNGRVLNQDVKPVAGAAVRVQRIIRRPPEMLTRYLDKTRRGEFETSEEGAAAKVWSGPFPGQATDLTTGQDGRFRLSGFGPDDEATLRIEGPGIQHADIFATTRPIDTVAFPTKQGPRFHIHGATFDYSPAPGRLIRGIVRDKATGKPVPGVQISSPWWVTTSKAQTDAKGRYELPGCRKSDQIRLEVRPAEGQPYFCADVHLADTLGLEPLAGDIELVSGIPCRGRLTDKETGKPIAGAEVHYNALYPSAFVIRLGDQGASPCSMTRTDADGHYTIMVLPGPGAVAFAARSKDSYVPAKVTRKDLADLFGDDEEHGGDDFLGTDIGGGKRSALRVAIYNAVVLIKPDEKEKSLTRDVALEQGATRSGKIVGPDGQPVTGVTVVGLREPEWQGRETLAGDSFTLRHLAPHGARTVLFYHKEKNLGASVDVRGDETGPVAVRLKRCGSATGRIVDADGQPIANESVTFKRVRVVKGGAAATLQGGEVVAKTDRDGRFRADGLVPGVSYTVQLRREFQIDFPLVVVETGQVKDLGEAKAKER